MSFILWRIKRSIEKREKERDAKDAERAKEVAVREANYEKMMLMIMQTGRANYVLGVATARAIQRIPDAKCNGDMKKALEDAEEMQTKEQSFLIDQGVKRIFGE